MLKTILSIPLTLLVPSCLLAQVVFGDGFENGDTCQWTLSQPDTCSASRIDVFPSRIDDVLTNPGMEVAILDRAGSEPATLPLAPLHLGIAGRQADGWYLISQVSVQ